MINPAFNLTLRAKRVLALAQAQAHRFNHEMVGAEHLLLGLIKLDQGVAVDALRKMGIDLETVLREVERQMGSNSVQIVHRHIPYSSTSTKVIALAEEERTKLNHSYLGTEHILLGLLGTCDTVAFRVLTGLGVRIEKTRLEVDKLLELPDADRNTLGPDLDRITAQYLEEQSGLL